MNKIYELKDVDLLVKVVSSVQFFLDGSFYYKVAFADDKKRIYLSELMNSGNSLQLEKNSVLKLRSIKIFSVNETFRIDFYDYSDILILP